MNEWYAMRITGKTGGNNLTLKNFTIDGDRNEQQLYNSTTEGGKSIHDTPIFKGIKMDRTNNVIVENTAMRDSYGAVIITLKIIIISL